MEEEYVTCYLCGGTGRVEHKGAFIGFRLSSWYEKCPVCGGTGKITKRELEMRQQLNQELLEHHRRYPEPLYVAVFAILAIGLLTAYFIVCSAFGG